MHRFLINLSDNLFQELREEAFEQKKSISSLVVEVLTDRAILTKLPQKVKTKIVKTIENTPELDELILCKHNARKGLCKYGCI